MEELSKNYLLTIASGSGYLYSTISHDFGTDLTIRKANRSSTRKRILTSGKCVDIQVKAVGEQYIIGLDDPKLNVVKYDLEVKNYNDLIERANESGPLTPLYLCVFIIPSDKKDWYTITPTELTIRKCAYWYSVPVGMSFSKNKKRVRIEIPKENIVCHEFYNKIFSSF